MTTNLWGDADTGNGWTVPKDTSADFRIDPPAHLTPKINRGSLYLPAIAIKGSHHGYVQMSESKPGASPNTPPHLCLRAAAPDNPTQPDGPWHEVTIHLTLEDAAQLADQLHWLIEDHYQNQS